MSHENGGSARAARPGPLRRVWPILVIVALLALGYLFGLQRYLSLETFIESREALRSAVASNFALSIVLYMAIYAALVAVAFPAASIVTIASGFVFGWLLGGVLTVVAATIGATIIFLAARHAFGDILRRRAPGAIGRFVEGFRNDAFSYLLVLRLTPVFPFFVLNIAPAFADIPARTYVASTFLGIIPGTFVFTFLGSGIDAAIANVAHAGPVTIGDLVTPQMTIALFGLAGLAILGLVLKKTVLRGRAVARDGEGGTLERERAEP